MGPTTNFELEQLAANIAWFLSLLIPAILIYWKFPSTITQASGPLHGLHVKLAGAFAAYIIIILVTYPVINSINSNFQSELHPTWQITGHVELEDADGRMVPAATLPDPASLSLDPTPIRMRGSDEFYAVVPEIDGQIPVIFINYKGYGQIVADPQNASTGQNIEIDRFHKKIIFTSRLYLRKSCTGDMVCAK